jgi:hypothetical protein
MRGLRSTAFAACVLVSSTLRAKPIAIETLCPSWSTAVKVGELDSKVIDESSGLSISRAQDSFYHMNDSGTGPEFHISRADGSNLISVHIEDYLPIDPEETALGPCPLTPEKTCLVIEDIGDNLKLRKSVAFFFIEEKNPWPKSVKPQFVARFKYPDGAHNAEAATVLDNGDIVLFTKELSIIGGHATPAVVFRSRRVQYLKPSSAKEPIEFEKIGLLDLPKLTNQEGLGGVATGIASIPSGHRFAILTYSGAVEFSLDLKALKFPQVITKEMWRQVPLFQLPQQESIAYDRGDRDLVYSTEVKLSQRFFGKAQPTPIYKVKCAL